jgi:hypothetical protein
MLAAIDVWDSIRRTRLAGEPPLQTAATRRAVFPGVGAAAMLPSVDATTARTCCPNRDARAFLRPGPAVARPGLGPHDRWLAAACAAADMAPLARRDHLSLHRAVDLTVDNQNRRHPHNDSVCCLRDFSRTRPRCMLPHATVTDPLVPVLPSVERQCMASRVMV